MNVNRQAEFLRSVCLAVLAEYERSSKEQRPSGATPYAVNPDSSTANPRSPLPTLLDFKADVELAAKAVLTRSEYQFFILYFLDGDREEALRFGYSHGLRRDKAALTILRNSLLIKVGKELCGRSIYPVAIYLHTPSKDQGRRACSCGDTEHSASNDSLVWCQGGCKRNMCWHDAHDWVISKTESRLWCHDCAVTKKLTEGR